MPAARQQLVLERRIVGTIGAGHFFSHFYFVALPLLFPILHDVYAVGYTELGIGYAVFSLSTAILQTPIGIFVDRHGARWVLVCGIAVEAVVMALLGVFQTYGAYLILMCVAGLANAVYHPCDYAILTRTIRQNRLGKAFSLHTFAGQVGSASAPLIIVLITWGIDWTVALILCGIMGLVIAVVVGFSSRSLDTAPETTDDSQATSKISALSDLKRIMTMPIILGWLFFIGYASATTGIFDFAASAFIEIYNSTLGQASMVVWLFLIAVAAGNFSAGFLADRWTNQELVAGVCYLLFVICMFIMAFIPMPLLVLAIPMAIAGFLDGFIAPSRDLIISSRAPKKDMGKVFGIVTSGYNIGGIIAPPAFGYLLDLGDPHSIFWGAGVIGLLTILTLVRYPNGTTSVQ